MAYPRKTVWFIERQDGTIISDSPARLLRRAEQSNPIPAVQRARYETFEGVGNTIIIDYFKYRPEGAVIPLDARHPKWETLSCMSQVSAGEFQAMQRIYKTLQKE